MAQLATVPANNIVYVQTQGTLATTDWANELHPNPGGFAKITTLFKNALSQKFPGRT
jgi:hypothetical protein